MEICRWVIIGCYLPVKGDNGRIRDEFKGKLCYTLNEYNLGDKKNLLLGDLNGCVGTR